MCGIVGYVGSRNCTDVLINGLTKLEYRGYDSAGIAVFSESGNIQVAKSKGRLADLIHKMEQEGRPEGHAGIGHTRWATHGEPSDINSHPHTGGRVTIVHNGIIENYKELKEYLSAKGVTFASDTDTEVVARLLDYNYNGSPIEAVFSASTGGYTESSENVWNTAVPYLRAVPEPGEYGDNSWTKTLTLDELTALLQAKGENIGTAKDIVITKLSTGGRVQELQIVGTSGTKTLTKEAIRTYFSSACGTLPSKMFTINGKGGTVTGGTSTSAKGGLLSAAARQGIVAKTEGALSYLNGKKLSVDVDAAQPAQNTDNGAYAVYNVSISTVANGKFVFSGSGSGHGVGLSQKGAQGMAQMGYDYKEILCHYYTGITIEG